MNARIPVRPLPYADRAIAKASEILADYGAGKLYIVAPDGTTIFEISGSGSVDSLSQLSDMDFTTPPADGQILIFNFTTQKWVPSNMTQGVSQLSQLTDVDGDATLSEGVALVYNDTSNLWEPRALLTTPVSAQLAAGVTVVAGNLIGYKAGGYVLSTNTDLTTLQGMMIAIANGSGVGGTVFAIKIGSYITTNLTDGEDIYVGLNGAYTQVAPSDTGSYIKKVGEAKGTTVLEFKTDSLAVKI